MLTNIQRVEFYRCPVECAVNVTADNPTGRCNFMKPNKYQRYPIRNDPKNERTRDRL
jgi:hypothetical protein